MAGGADTISTNGTNFTIGDELIITFSFYGRLQTCSGTLYIGNTSYAYSNCSNPKLGTEAKDSNPFSFTLTETGTYDVYYISNMFGITSNVITITVEDDNPPSNQVVSWGVNNKTVETLHINSKEVQKIEATIDNEQVILWQKAKTAKVQIVWSDDNNSAGMRPASVAVNCSNVGQVTLNASNNFEYEFKVPQYDTNGNEITYNWTSETILGYKIVKTVSNDITTFTCTYRNITPPSPIV